MSKGDRDIHNMFEFRETADGERTVRLQSDDEDWLKRWGSTSPRSTSGGGEMGEMDDDGVPTLGHVASVSMASSNGDEIPLHAKVCRSLLGILPI